MLSKQLMNFTILFCKKIWLLIFTICIILKISHSYIVRDTLIDLEDMKPHYTCTKASKIDDLYSSEYKTIEILIDYTNIFVICNINRTYSEYEDFNILFFEELDAVLNILNRAVFYTNGSIEIKYLINFLTQRSNISFDIQLAQFKREFINIIHYSRDDCYKYSISKPYQIIYKQRTENLENIKKVCLRSLHKIKSVQSFYRAKNDELKPLIIIYQKIEKICTAVKEVQDQCNILNKHGSSVLYKYVRDDFKNQAKRNQIDSTCFNPINIKMVNLEILEIKFLPVCNVMYENSFIQVVFDIVENKSSMNMTFDKAIFSQNIAIWVNMAETIDELETFMNKSSYHEIGFGDKEKYLYNILHESCWIILRLIEKECNYDLLKKIVKLMMNNFGEKLIIGLEYEKCDEDYENYYNFKYFLPENLTYTQKYICPLNKKEIN